MEANQQTSSWNQMVQHSFCSCDTSDIILLFVSSVDNSLETLKKDASHSLIQLLESAAKEADRGTEGGFEYQDTNDVHLTAGAETLLSTFKIKDEIARQMMESSLLCLVCKQNFKSANELSQHLQVSQS